MPVVTNHTALLSGLSFNGEEGRGAFISWSMPTSVPAYLSRYYEAGLETFRGFTGTSATIVRNAIAQFGAATGITFLEVAPGQGDINFMGFNLAALGDDESAGFAYYPSDGYPFDLGSDVFIDRAYMGDTLTILHEIGHALGLKHPFEGDVTLREDIDNTRNTVMSYTYAPGTGQTLGRLDLDALHQLYGTDAIDGSQVASWRFDRPASRLTQTGDEGDNRIYGIHAQDTIEGRGGNDMIFGRYGRDVIDGGDGDDVISYGEGTATLRGGAGDDVISFFASPTERVTIDGGAGYDTVVVDTVTYEPEILDLPAQFTAGGFAGIESVVLDLTRDIVDYQRITGTAVDDVITLAAGLGHDVLGAAGDDTIDGSKGGAVLRGGDGNDRIVGQGWTVLSGDAGDDVIDVIGKSEIDGGTGFDRLLGTWVGFAHFTSDRVSISSINIAGIESVEMRVNGNRITSDGSLRHVDIVIGATGTQDVLVDVGDAEGAIAGANRASRYIAGGGAITYSGERSADIYVFDRIGDSSLTHADRITNFQTGRDKIDIAAFAAGQFTLTPEGLVVTTADGAFTLYSDAPIAAGDVIAVPIDRAYGVNAVSIFGTGGTDRITGNANDNNINGHEGADIMSGGVGNDQYDVDNAGDVVIEASLSGNDSVRSQVDFSLPDFVENLQLRDYAAIGRGNAGNNMIDASLVEVGASLFGLAGDDSLRGSDHDDVLDGGSGSDVLQGLAGDDLYIVTDVLDRVRESTDAGYDAVRTSVDYVLPSSVEKGTLFAAGVQLTGNDEANELYGSTLANTLRGGGGNDVVMSGAGKDALYGDAGDDSLTGGGDADQLWGGTGRDTIRYAAAGDSGATYATADMIGDFSRTEGDRIDLRTLDAIAGTAANDAFAFIGRQGFHGTAGELRWLPFLGDTLVQADLNGDRTVDFAIVLDGAITLAAGDFML